MTTTCFVLVLVAAALGFGTGLYAGRSRPSAQPGTEARMAAWFRAASAEAVQGALETAQRQLAASAEGRVREEGLRAAGELARQEAAVEHLVGPLRETLARVEAQLREVESARTSTYASLLEQVSATRASSEQLRQETGALVAALRKPQTRGRWGELQLRRLLEVAGMTERCDFVEQPTVVGPDGVQRPDVVVTLTGGRCVVVDSKVSLAAYLEAYETSDDAVRELRLDAHARHLRAHVDALAAKKYWQQFPTAPEFVLLFVPGDAFLAAALERDTGLLEDAIARRVHIASPTTLVSALRTIAFAWQQDALSRQTQEVFDLGRTLYERLGTLGGHVDKLGRSLTASVRAYNDAVGSLEGRVLVPARRLAALGVVDPGPGLVAPAPVEDAARPLGAPELVDTARIV